MNHKGINYDVGTPTTHGTWSRETFDPVIVRREIEIIKNDLHCNAIRISGQSLERLSLAAKFALEQGLEVWFSPSLPDADQQETLKYLGECAQAAEQLRQPGSQIVFVVGVELSAFMRGLLDGDTPVRRLGTLMNPLRLIKSTILKGSYHKNLNKFLLKATTLVREHFHGQITYASGPWENVKWSLFDFVGVDYYRDAMNRKMYEKNLLSYFKHGKPVVITEFGSCTYQGAEDKGGYGWVIVDWTKTPPQLKREFIRDESTQANYVIELLEIFEEAQVDGAFVFTFVSSSYPNHPNPLYDLDMASYSLVKTYTDQTGTTYQDMPWEPKESFFKLADHYGTSNS
jgi:hypothetical protein